MNSYNMLKSAYVDDYRFRKFVIKLARKLVRIEYGSFYWFWLTPSQIHEAITRYVIALDN